MAVSNKDLKAKLGAALGDKKPVPVSVAAEEQANARITAPRRGGSRGNKTSVNVFESDLELLDAIRELLKKEGFRRVADSQLLRLMCRDYRPGPDTVHIMRQIMSEDGRRRETSV